MAVIPTPEQVRDALGKHHPIDMPELPGRHNQHRAGVLVPLIWDQRLTCIFTLRSKGLRQHAGEVSFPGGRPDSNDRDLAHTAMREANEELGIVDVSLLGQLSSVPVLTSQFRLCPFVAQVTTAPLIPNVQEVERVLRLDVGHVLRQPSIAAVEYRIPDGGTLMAPTFELEGELLYGATAFCFFELLGVLAPLFGAAVPRLVAS